ncbi:MAG TPA: DUF3450 family protein [Lacunisphaera sp.]
MSAPAIRSFLPVIAALCVSLAHGAPTDSVDALATVSLDWAKTRSETVRAETAWASQRELLDSTVNALEERARELESKRDLLKAKTAKDSGELENLEIENQRLHEQFGRLENALKAIDERFVKLRPQLPPRLSQALELPFRSLAEPDLAAGSRMAHTITLISRCAQFNRSISFGEEIVAASGEAQAKLMQTVYWGLSHGYAYDRGARKAWIGAPGPNGWAWVPCAEEGVVRELIATFDEKAEPTFVAMPATAGRPINPSTAR